MAVLSKSFMWIKSFKVDFGFSSVEEGYEAVKEAEVGTLLPATEIIAGERVVNKRTNRVELREEDEERREASGLRVGKVAERAEAIDESLSRV